MNAGFGIGAANTPVKTGSAARPSTARTGADFPVTFANTVGLYCAPEAGVTPTDTAVLFVSSWGFEELCARKFWRLLAAELAQQGIASLRFDYPGTGDALDHPDYAPGLELWHDSVVSAATTLRDISGAKKLLLIGHGIGAAFAWRAAETMGDVAGLALAAPALSGRHWLREFVALSRIANQSALHITPVASGPTMGEQSIPEPVLAGIRTINIATAATAPAPDILLLAQSGRPADAAFAQHLATLGIHAQSLPFEGYDRFISDVLFSVPPVAAIGTLAQWARGLASDAPSPAGDELAALPLPATLPLNGGGFVETPVRFGESNRLYGMLCEPKGPRRGATVMILPTGYERMSGWGRITANVCRNLARSGIASLRFDVGNIADSPPQPGAPEQIIYNDCQVRDASAAMAFLEERKLFPVVITGRCSGAYTAFRSAARDGRYSAVVPVNMFDFYVAPDADIEMLIASSMQPLSSYGAKMRDGGFWRRVLRGEVRVKNGVRTMWKMIVAKAVSMTTPLMVRFPLLPGRFRTVAADFQALASHGTLVSVIFTEDDVGTGLLEASFGARGHLMSRYKNTGIQFIPDADHNLTTAHAREFWQDELHKVAIQFPPKA